MKTTNVLVSLLFGSIAAAAPFDKRALVTKTEIVWETDIVYVTVWDKPAPAPATVAPAATTQPGLFYEQPHDNHHASTSTSPAYTPPPPPSTPVYTPPPAYTPPPPPPASSSVYTPPPAPSSVYTPAPAPAPAPVSSAPAPAQSSSAPNYGGGSPGGNSDVLKGTHSGFDITVYDTENAAGACGEILHDTDPIVALGYLGMGPSTYNVQTGEATMPACGQKIRISYNGKTTDATIKDKCPGCQGKWDIDLSRAVWAALGITETTRLKADWWTID